MKRPEWAHSASPASACRPREEPNTDPGSQDRLFGLGLGPYCADCPVLSECGAELTEYACAGAWGDPGQGGEAVLHPDRPDVFEHVRSLRGFRLDAFKAKAVSLPVLPNYLAQIPFRSALCGHLEDEFYALRPQAIIGRRVKTAEEVRAFLELSPNQHLVALLFDKDELIERPYQDPRLLAQLANAGYDLIVSPSYSIWEPRARLHQLYNLTRSLAVCIALQQLGAPAIPRLDWVIDHDVKRWARWLDANPSVELVAIDAMTSRSNGWEQLLSGLVLLEKLTGRRLRYLINGPSVAWRWEQLHSIIPAGRLTLTDARLWSAKPTAEERLEFPGPYADAFGPRFRKRVQQRRSALENQPSPQ